MSLAAALELGITHNDRQALMIEQSRTVMRRAFAASVNNPSDLAMVDWIERASALDTAYRDAAVSTSVDFVRQYEEAVTGELPSGVVDLAAARNAVRNGLPLGQLWARPIIRTRALLARGNDLATALDRAADYAGDLQATNTGLAARAGSAGAMAASSRIVGYRRVTDAGACVYCLLASTQRYTVKTLMPLHGSTCRCSTMPIIGSADPGRVIDKELLGALKAEGIKGDASRAFKREVRIETHGELGPQLVPARQGFTGPAGLPERARKAVPAPIPPAALVEGAEGTRAPARRARRRGPATRRNGSG